MERKIDKLESVIVMIIFCFLLCLFLVKAGCILTGYGPSVHKGIRGLQLKIGSF